jgi:hypothetical protein
MKQIPIVLFSILCFFGSAVFAGGLTNYECKESLLKQVKGKDFSVQGMAQCLSVDLDGNGQDEVVVFKENPSQDSGTSPTFQARAYFLKNGKILKSVAINHKFGLPPMQYKSDETFKRYGCPDSKVSGVIDPGEGGSNRIFLWQNKKSRFQEFTCRSEDA